VSTFLDPLVPWTREPPSFHLTPIFFLAGWGGVLGWGFLFRRTLLLFLFGLRSSISSLGSLALSVSPEDHNSVGRPAHTHSLCLWLSLSAIYNTSIATLGLWMLYTTTYSSFLFCISRCTENTPKLIITEVDNSTASLKPAILMLLQCRRRLLKFMICRFPCEWIVFGLE